MAQSIFFSLFLLFVSTSRMVLADVAATSVLLDQPYALAVADNGDIIIADTYNQRIRRINTAAGTISTVGGSGNIGYNGDGISATTADINYPTGVATDTSGNIYFCDKSNNRVRYIDITTNLITTVAGTGAEGFNGDGIAATTATLNQPYGIALKSNGDVVFADKNNNRIRLVSKTTGLISTVAGTGEDGYNGDSIAATSAHISLPKDIAVNSAGDIYFTDKNNNLVRKVSSSTGLITAVCGNGTYGYNGENLPGVSAQLAFPTGIAVDASNNIYFSDKNNNRVRKLDTNGFVFTIAGSGVFGYNGDGQNAVLSDLYSPYGVAVSRTATSAADVYFADKNNNLIRKVSQSTGNLYNVAGSVVPTVAPTVAPTVTL